MSSRKDDFACFICDYWWIFIIFIMGALVVVFTEPLWLPPLLPTPMITETNTLLPSTPGTGDVQITLLWSGRNDLDLHVIDPLGEELFYKLPTSTSHGELDIDSNLDCRSNMTDSPIENIYWPFGKAPTGQYQVHVVYFKQCTGQTVTPFSVRVLVDGETKNFDGTITFEGEEILVYDFGR